MADTGTGKTIVAAFDFLRLYKEITHKRPIIAHFSPKILLGLTATPERMDGKSILEDFDHRIAYEIRLNQAIEQNLLCPSPLMYPFEGLALAVSEPYHCEQSNGSKVMLFVREERSDENGKTEVYTCLGLVDYTSHQGSAPISIIYKLREKMPVKLMRVSNRFVGMG
ncbi:hypothetical protein [Fusibacter bizertensis]